MLFLIKVLEYVSHLMIIVTDLNIKGYGNLPRVSFAEKKVQLKTI